jgi:hypothetical protein
MTPLIKPHHDHAPGLVVSSRCRSEEPCSSSQGREIRPHHVLHAGNLRACQTSSRLRRRFAQAFVRASTASPLVRDLACGQAAESTPGLIQESFSNQLPKIGTRDRRQVPRTKDPNALDSKRPPNTIVQCPQSMTRGALG